MERLPPEAETIKDLNRIAEIIALVFGIIYLIIGVATIIILIGVIFILFGIINFIIRSNLQQINKMINEREFKKAKEKQFVWMVIGFILAGIIVGVILLIAYLRYDALLREVEK